MPKKSGMTVACTVVPSVAVTVAVVPLVIAIGDWQVGGAPPGPNTPPMPPVPVPAVPPAPAVPAAVPPAPAAAPAVPVVPAAAPAVPVVPPRPAVPDAEPPVPPEPDVVPAVPPEPDVVPPVPVAEPPVPGLPALPVVPAVPLVPPLPGDPLPPVPPLPDPLEQAAASVAQAKTTISFLCSLLTVGLRGVPGTRPECPLIRACKGRLFMSRRGRIRHGFSPVESDPMGVIYVVRPLDHEIAHWLSGQGVDCPSGQWGRDPTLAEVRAVLGDISDVRYHQTVGGATGGWLIDVMHRTDPAKGRWTSIRSSGGAADRAPIAFYKGWSDLVVEIVHWLSARTGPLVVFPDTGSTPLPIWAARPLADALSIVQAEW